MLEVTNTVLIVIDVQEKLARVMHERDTMVANLQKLVKGIKVLGVPVIVTEQYPKGLGPTIPEIASLLQGVPVIPKTSFSCWNDDAFLRSFKSMNRKQVLISGIEGHVCVYQTVCDLVSNGFETYVVTDTITSRTPENRQLSITMMQQAGAHLTGVEAALFELLKVAEGERFKEISRIIK
jgi:nicotinamidase-related amidase